MSANIWTKTILTSYRYFERIANAIDKMIERSGLNSRDMSGASYSCNNIYNLAEKLIDLGERKVKLINLKVLTEDSLKSCGESFASILILKYIDQKKNHEIIEAMGMSYRTFFRRLNDAELRFEEVLKSKGFDNKKLEDYLSSERWIVEIKNRLQTLRAVEEFEVSEYRLDKLAVS